MIVNVGNRDRLSKNDSDKLHIEVCKRAAIASFFISHHLQHKSVELLWGSYLLSLYLVSVSTCMIFSLLDVCVEVSVVGVASISSHVISWQNGLGVPCCGKACSPLV